MEFEEKVRRLVVFAILMESNDGIMNKAPSYVMEKFESSMNVPYYWELLDYWNKRKYERWLKAWRFEE